MLIPEVDAKRINEIINHESVRPWVAGDIKGNLDADILVKNKANFFFVGEHGGSGFIKLKEGIYDLHSFVLPSGRGSWVKENFQRVRDWMFINTDAIAIVTLCPKNNRMAIGAARMCGFKKYATIERSWIHNGDIFDMDAYVVYKGVI